MGVGWCNAVEAKVEKKYSAAHDICGVRKTIRTVIPAVQGLNLGSLSG
jgi:hypothetical protein